MSLAQYQFLPWLREGLGNAIKEVDTLGLPQTAPVAGGAVPGGRASITLDMDINGWAAGAKEFMIVGPPDVIGFSKDLVIRTEPLNWSTAFASNLLAHIEFYDEDFPWRYSPAKAESDKLRPWISMIVLKEEEFERESTVVPLPQIKLKVDPLVVLPDYHETWLWAHVQKIEASTLPSDKTAADHIISRLICPRKLEANTAYYAFVIPTFESGRLSGLGKSEAEIKLAKSQDPAWGMTTPPLIPQTTFPVYYEWFFRTAAALDFEYLASLLEPKAVDPQVGKKTIDCRKPGFGIPAYGSEFTLYMEGALKAPPSQGAVGISNDSATSLQNFEIRIQQLLNLNGGGTGDPVVTPPFYGQKHIFEESLSLTIETWIHQLNKSPAYRAVSGLGANVFAKYQDQYLQKAWEQLESIVEANKIIDAANSTLAVCQELYKNMIRLSPEELISMAGPVLVKVKIKDSRGKAQTLFQAFKDSCFNGSMYSSAFRRLTSRRGAFRRKLEQNGVPFDLASLKKLLIAKAGKPFTLDGRRYNILITDRPDFKATDQSSFGDRPLAISLQDLKGVVNAFAAVVQNPPPKEPCAPTIRHKLVESLNPSVTITNLLAQVLEMPVPNWFSDPLKIKDALAYPDFEDPMVEKLMLVSPEWLAPNLHLIPNNSITILQSNRKFIEAFMVGVNVAMNREMRWREYPTDERGSCFRQFWNVKGIKDINSTQANPAQVVEQFKDISPIHTWKNWTGAAATQRLDEFGEHNISNELPDNEPLVLVLRGDLLKCFPNTTIYAAKASEVSYVENGNQLTKLSIPANPGTNDIKFPLFKADGGVDLKFVGFDLTESAARGDAANPHGWFFVLQETPGETRFGLDISGPATTGNFTWDDASWELVSGGKISIADTASSAKVTAFETSLALAEKNPDGSLKRKWGKTSADMAYILYQKPVMIAIHANEMLPEL